MNKIVISCFLLLMAVSVSQATERHTAISKVIKPVLRSPDARVPFLAPQHYIDLAKGAKVFTGPDTQQLWYYNIDPNDNSTYTGMGLPFYFQDGTGVYAYGERFTAEHFTRFTVDSFSVTFAVNSFADAPGNRILFTLRKKGNFPGNPNVFPAFTYVDTAQILSTSLTDIVNDGLFHTFTIPFAKKTHPAFSTSTPDFWIFMELPDTVGNDLRVMADNVFDDPSNHGNPRPDGDRSYMYFSRNDTTYISFMGGTFQNTQTGEVLYNQLVMTAYISGTSSDVASETANANSLGQNFPNPFNPSTEIRYTLAERSSVSLKVYNTLGREVASLVNGTVDAGEHTVTLQADNLPSGTYYYTLKAGDFSQTKRMVLAK